MCYVQHYLQKILVVERVELREILLVQRLRCRRVERKRVDRAAVLPDSEVEMRACGGAGRSDVSDKLALRHPRADLDAPGELGEVHVGTLIPAHVLYLDAVASARAVPSAFGHHSVADGVDFGACRRGIVHCRVGLDLACDRMLPVI